MNELETDQSAEYRRVNVEGTRGLARAAVEAGARRLIYVSSIKVNGESTRGQPFRESDEPRPRTRTAGAQEARGNLEVTM